MSDTIDYDEFTELLSTVEILTDEQLSELIEKCAYEEGARKEVNKK